MRKEAEIKKARCSERLELASQLHVAPAALANNVARDLLDSLCGLFACLADHLAAGVALVKRVSGVAASFTNQ